MRINKSLTAGSGDKISFSKAITGASLQNLIKASVPNAKAAARFTGTLVSVVAQNPALQKVNPASIVACALRGEGAGLQIGRDYHVVPFGQTATYVIGYKGLLALLMATGEVDDADCIPVYEGEIIGRNKRTKRPEFSFYDTEEEERQHPVIGYYFYISFTNGSFRFQYMSIPEILDHAERYSKTFNRAKYDQMMSGEFTGDALEKLKSSSPWYSAAETMMKKTVIRSLLNSGYVRIANDAGLREALDADESYKSDILPDLDMPEAPIPATAEEYAGEDADDAAEAVQDDFEEPAPSDTAEEKKAAGRGRKSAESADPVGSFFD